MANDVFLSYARTDIARARQIKDLLEGLGLTVFFDTEGLDGGDVFPDILDREVKAAGAVVGVWSTHALSRPWVKIECDIGKTRGVLVPLQIEPIADLDRPAAFWNIQFADLSDFDGDADHAGWLRFVRALARTLNRPDLLERESAAQAATPDSLDASVRDELAALRAELADMREAKAPLAEIVQAQVPPPVEPPKAYTEPERGRNIGVILGALALLVTIGGVASWAVMTGVFAPTERPTPAPAESDGVAYHVEACEKGITAGCMSAATAYAYGEGVEADHSLSLDYYDRGCDLGDMEACWVGGIVHEQDGELETARTLYDRACQGGAQDGCGLLSDLNLVGDVAGDDDARYAEAQADGRIALYRDYLSVSEFTRHRNRVETAVSAHETAIKRLQRALIEKGFLSGGADGMAGPGTKRAVARFASDAQSTQTIPDFDQIDFAPITRLAAAVEAWSKPAPTPPPAPPKPSWAQGLTNDKASAHAEGCIEGSMFDCNELGYMYDEAQGVTQDYGEARRLYTKACNGGNMSGCNNLGYMYKHALGVTQDYGEARRLYTKACNGGEMLGCNNLERLPD